MKRVYHLPLSLPPAIPFDVDNAPVVRSRWLETDEHCTVFEDRDRAIVGHFRRSSRIQLQGQVSLYG